MSISTLHKGDYDDNNNNNNNRCRNFRRQNVIKKEAENILKYKDLTTETQRMCNVKTKVIPSIMWATVTNSKTFRKITQQHTGKVRNKGTAENSYTGH